MTEKSLFSAAVRVLGIYSFARGFNDLLYVFLYIAGGLDDTSVMKPFPSSEAIYGWVFLLAGLYMLRGAPLVVRYAFPEDRNGEEEQESDDLVKSA